MSQQEEWRKRNYFYAIGHGAVTPFFILLGCRSRTKKKKKEKREIKWLMYIQNRRRVIHLLRNPKRRMIRIFLSLSFCSKEKKNTFVTSPFFLRTKDTFLCHETCVIFFKVFFSDFFLDIRYSNGQVAFPSFSSPPPTTQKWVPK